MIAAALGRRLDRWRRLGLGAAAGWASLLTHWPWFETLRTLKQRFREDHLGLTAGSLTFTTLMSLVPLMTVGLAAFSAFPIFGRFQQALQQNFLKWLVPPGIAQPVMDTLAEFSSKASQLGTAGLFVLLIIALALIHTIDETLNAIWRVRRPRPLMQRVMFYWAALTLGPLVVGAMLSIMSLLAGSTRGLSARLPGGLALSLEIAQFAMLVVATTLLFRHAPNTHVKWRHALAGGVFVAVGFEIAKRSLGWYVRTMPTYSAVYGAFATLPIFFLWIYVGWLVVLLGAVVAAYAPSLAMQVSRRPDRPGERFALASAIVARLAAAPERGRPGLGVEALAAQLRVDPLQLELPIEALQALNWIGRLAEPGDPRWVLLVNPERTPAAPLVDALLLGEKHVTASFRRHAGFERMTLAQVIAG